MQYYLSSLLTATLVLMIGGFPAALYERFVGGGVTSAASMWIWTLAVAVLSLPAIGVFLFG